MRTLLAFLIVVLVIVAGAAYLYKPADKPKPMASPVTVAAKPAEPQPVGDINRCVSLVLSPLDSPVDESWVRSQLSLISSHPAHSRDVQVCAILSTALNDRRQFLARYSRDKTDPSGQTGAGNAHMGAIRGPSEAEKAQTEAEATDTYFLAGIRNEWAQRCQWYQRSITLQERL
jgi:hypothetical protein